MFSAYHQLCPLCFYVSFYILYVAAILGQVSLLKEIFDLSGKILGKCLVKYILCLFSFLNKN